MSNELERDRFVALIDKSLKDEIDDTIMSKRIRKFSEAYRYIVAEGFKIFKKNYKEKED